MKGQRRPHTAGGYRPERRRHQRFKLRLSRTPLPALQVDVAGYGWIKQWREHRESHQVIHMCVADQQRKMLLWEKPLPGPAREAGARIQDNGLTACPHQHTTGCSAKAGKLRTMDGQGPPNTQKFYLHGVLQGKALLFFSYH